MLKKILFTFLTLLVIYSSCVIAYRIFEPRDNYAVDKTTSYVAYDSLKPYDNQNGEMEYVDEAIPGKYIIKETKNIEIALLDGKNE